MSIGTEKRTYLNDAVKDVSDDFGIHSKIANALSKKIIDADVQKTSLTIGLLGEWGSGKSVIIEKIRECLSEDSSISFSVIDVWKYNGMPLLRHILNEIVEQLPASFSKKDIAEIKRYKDSAVLVGKSLQPMQSKVKAFLSKGVKIIAIVSTLALLLITICGNLIEAASGKTVTNLFQSILASISVPSVIATIFSSKVLATLGEFFGKIQEDLIVIDKTIVPTISPEQFDDILNEIFDKLKKHNVKKNIIVFDNIDRCRPEFAYEVLSTIKTYLDKPNCIYIIPCDDISIKHYLDNQYGSNGKSSESERDFSADFLDKLFTTYFRLPPISELSRDEFIKKCLDSTVLEELPNKDSVMQVLYYAYKGETPRQIKRFINDFISYYEIALQIDPEKTFLLDDIITFTVMISIKQIAPDYEKKLINNPELISMANDSDANNASDRIKEIFKRLHFQFPKEKSVLTYVFFNEVNIDQEIRSQLRDAQSVEINLKSLKAILTTIRNDKANEDFLINDFIAICNSITQIGVDNFWAQPDHHYDYSTLKKELEDLLSYKSPNKNAIYPIIPYTYMESLLPEKNAIYQGMSLLLQFDSFSSIQNEFFRAITTMKNHLSIFEVISEHREFGFSYAIKSYFADIAAVNTEGLPEHDIRLIEALVDNSIFELFDSSIIKILSRSTTHNAKRLKKLEYKIFESANVAECIFEKIKFLIETCAAIVNRHGTNVSTDIDELFENLDYLFSLNSLPIDVLENAAKFDQDDVCSQLGLLTQLSSLTEQSINNFMLGCKLFGDKFIKETYSQNRVIYNHRAALFQQASSDIAWLEKISTCPSIWTKSINEHTLLASIIEKTKPDWRISQISSFIKPPISLSVFEALCDSFNKDEKELVKQHCVSKAIISLAEYLKDNRKYDSQKEVVGIFDCLCSKFDSIGDALILGEMTFDEVNHENIVLGTELLNVFKKYNVLYKNRLQSILATIPDHIKQKSIDKHSGDIIIENIKAIILDTADKERLLDVIDEAIDISRDDFIIELGIVCIEKLIECGINTLEQFSQKLELIRDSGRLVARIDTLLKTDNLVSEESA